MSLKIIVLFTILDVCRPEVQILDYSNSQLVPIHLGQARLQNGSFKLIHVLNLTQYESIIQEIESEIQNKILRNSTLMPFFLHDIEQMKKHLEIIRPRKKRSINFLGTAWKWVAGTPDYDDHKIVVQKMEGLLENNERQRIINREVLERVNVLTNTTNHIIKTIQSLEEVRRIQEETITNKLRLLKEEIVNVEYALQWSKVGVINSFILSEREMSEVKQFLDQEKFPYTDLEQALSFATIKIATDYRAIIYIVNLPAIDNKICEKLLIKPIKKGNKIVKINTENIIRCSKEIYELRENCKEYNKLCICSEEKLIDISNTNCIPLLLSSRKHDCVVINNQHINTVQELYPGTILLNQFVGIVGTSNNETSELRGTYLIQFHNDTITVANKTYISKEITDWKPLPALLQPTKNGENLEEVLSLELMKDLQTSNIERLASMSAKGKVMFSLNLGLIIVLTVCILAMAYKLRTKSKSNLTVTNIIKEKHPPVTENSGELPVSREQRCEFRSINDLPIH